MANIRDIAKITGYSVSTISRVINQNPYVAEEKRQRVLEVMTELDYIPNHHARTLSSGETKNIGVILPFVNQPYFDKLLSGITDAAFRLGYKVTLLPTNYDPQVEQRYLQEFAAKGFDALIITSRANSLDVLLPYLKYGVIIFCEDVPTLVSGCVYIDREAAIREVFTYLREQNISRIGVTLGRSRSLSSSSKITVNLCQEFFPEFTFQDIFWDCLTVEDGEAATAFFEGRDYQAIFANNDLVAFGVKKSLTEDRLVIGRDNLLVSQLLGISTIDFHLQTCGEMALKLAIGEETGKHRIPYAFILRENEQCHH